MTVTQLFVGSYTGRSRSGIHVYDVASGGALDPVGSSDAADASFLTVRADLDMLYAVRESTDAGSVVALRLSEQLRQVDVVPSQGGAPCHLSTDGERLYVANYASGSVAAYELLPDGRFGDLIGVDRFAGSGPHPRQEAPHAHCIVPDQSSAHVYATDLGSDRIVQYDAHRDGLAPVATTMLAPGSGSRHLAFHPSEPFAFVSCELDNTVATLHVDDATGHLSPTSTVSTLPDAATDTSTAAEVAVHPTGRWVYVSNRGHDSIATFAVDAGTGRLDAVGHIHCGGRTPRHIAIDPSGEFLVAANQDTDTIVAFSLVDGLPIPIGVVAEVAEPVCLVFVRSPG